MARGSEGARSDRSDALRRPFVGLRLCYRLVQRAGRGLLSVVGLVGVVSSLIIGVEVLLVARVVTQFNEGRGALGSLVALAVLTAARRLANVIGNEGQWLVAERVERSVVEETLEVAGRSAYADFESPEFQDQLQRAIEAGRNDVWGAAWGLFQVATSFSTMIALVLVLVLTAPILIVPFAVAAVGLGAVALLKSRMTYRFEYADTPDDRERRYLREALVSRSEGRETLLFGTGSRLRERHHVLFGRRLFELERLLRRRTGADALAAVGAAVVLAAVLVLLGRAVTDGSLELAAAAAAAVAAHQLSGSQSRLFNGLSTAMESSHRVADLDAFLTRPRADATGTPAVEAEAIELDDVSFRYPDTTRDALVGISLRVGRGELVAVVGDNGSGKTTLGRILLGLYQPTSGDATLVRADGARTPITAPLTGVASALFQDFARYELSVENNVALGCARPVGPGRVDALLDVVDLTDQVKRLPEGIETRLGRQFGGGVDLSIGQWQRLSLARAGANPDASFIVLDEPSASLDPRMESALIDRLRALFPHQGVLLISHRLAAVHAADHIVVLRDGVIAEEGDHSTLMNLNGIYAALRAEQRWRLGADVGR